LRDVEKLRLAGFAHGASLDNTVAIGDDGILNPEGLRYPDEFVRHKMLDAVGDLSLAGLPILGHYRSYVGGHKLNVSMLTALFSDRSAYAIVEAGKPVARPVDAAAMSIFPVGLRCDWPSGSCLKKTLSLWLKSDMARSGIEWFGV